ncbi:hypothetical protein MNV49_003374 [Pseudohyphozyma bogoriensis]|nr:hypothetical protein MNV49_003374 [Pseudohyphozyma bogoriensis]
MSTNTRTYADAINALNSLQSNAAVIEAIRLSGGKGGEAQIVESLEYLKRIGYSPEDLNPLNVIHITGTKGKGSTSAFTERTLRELAPHAKTGLYTSPHLVAVRERIRINGKPIEEELFAKYFFEVWDRWEKNTERADPKTTPEKPAYFRFLTFMAFHVFLQEKVDATVLEVGVGGTYDSTNIVPKPITTGVTSLGIDHIFVLGRTLPEIAAQKGGIYKPGVPALAVDQPAEGLDVLRARAAELKASSFTVVPEHPELTGVSLAIVEGLKKTSWPGRCQIAKDPQVGLTWFLDGAHTVESLKCCGDWFAESSSASAKKVLIFNCTSGRSGLSLLGTLLLALPPSPFSHVVFCTNTTYSSGASKGDLTSNAVDTKDLETLATQRELAAAWEELTATASPESKAEVHVLGSIQEAVELAKAVGGETEVLVTGSLHLVALGLREICAERGWEFVVTSDKEGANSEAEKHLVDADTPFHPLYITRERIAKAKNLKLCITAGVGSDHVDLNAANERKITVAEVTGSNVVSVAEHVVMSILLLVRNFVPAHEQIISGGWDVAAVAKDAYDLEGKVIGTLAAGRIGFRVLQRLVPFNPKELLYYDYQALPPAAEKEVGARRVEDLKEFLGQLDVLTINAPLHEKTKGLINKETLSYLKPGAWIVNTARGAICVAEDVAAALESGHIAGYAGDVWNVQPSPKDHPWRSMRGPHGNGNGMVAHYSADLKFSPATLDAQARYAAGTKEILLNWADNKAQTPANIIVTNGDYATKAYGQRKLSAFEYAVTTPPAANSPLPTRSAAPPYTPTHILFITVPALKATLLQIVRVTLVMIPLCWRWGFFRRFPGMSRPFWAIPVVCVCLVVALGLDQSSRTARWRLLLMSQREELEWANHQFDEIIAQEAILILPPTDPRVAVVQRVCSRLIQSLQEETPVSCANFPREEIADRLKEREKRKSIVPSARTEIVGMPFLPESSNPEKMLNTPSWDIFVVDLPKINAYVLPNFSCFCYTGLLDVADGDENLLAAVLSHELSHVTERHSTEALGFLALSGVVFDVLRGASWALTLSFPFVGDALAVFFNFCDRTLGQRAFNRKLESEADALGLELMARAGYDPRGALRLWKILNEVEEDVTENGEHGSIVDHIALLRTHPTGQQRLETLESLLPAAIKIYDETIQGKAQAEPMGPASLHELKKNT